MDVSWFDVYCAITGIVYDEEGSWYMISATDKEMNKCVVRITTVKVMEEGTLQVRQQGSAVNITRALRDTITKSNWWSLRIIFKNEADVKMCYGE